MKQLGSRRPARRAAAGGLKTVGDVMFVCARQVAGLVLSWLDAGASPRKRSRVVPALRPILVVLALAGTGLLAVTASASASSMTIPVDTVCSIAYNPANPGPGGGTCSHGGGMGEYDCDCPKVRAIVQFN